MNDIVEIRPQMAVVSARMSASDIIDHVKSVQEVMRAIMKDGVHYGTVPGTDKPTLLKPGAEALCVAFRIADKYEVEDLSGPDVVRYRVTCIGEHQLSGIVLGSGLGECSSNEEKYKWRKAVCPHEFAESQEGRKRTKYAKGKGGSIYTVDQIRTEPSDVANTVLKMAIKRAKTAMVLNVTGASDMFSQDLEDLDELLREHLTEDSRIAHLEGVRQEHIAAAQACTTTDELTKVMKAGVKHFQESKDPEGYKQFAAAVQAHGAKLKAESGKDAA